MRWVSSMRTYTAPLNLAEHWISTTEYWRRKPLTTARLYDMNAAIESWFIHRFFTSWIFFGNIENITNPTAVSGSPWKNLRSESSKYCLQSGHLGGGVWKTVGRKDIFLSDEKKTQAVERDWLDPHQCQTVPLQQWPAYSLLHLTLSQEHWKEHYETRWSDLVTITTWATNPI